MAKKKTEVNNGADHSELAAQFFTDHPESKEVFATEDGFLFTDRIYACSHAETLEVKEPTHYTNPAFVETDAEIVE